MIDSQTARPYPTSDPPCRPRKSSPPSLAKARLSPWPNPGTAGLTAAIAKLRRVVPNLEDDTRAREVGELASAMVEGYAPGAPSPVKDEAVVRICGYLAQSSAYGAIRRGGVGPLSIEYPSSHSSMFRNCGAQAILTRWKIRRAGVIG